jgi:hypothetical protein
MPTGKLMYCEDGGMYFELVGFDAVIDNISEGPIPKYSLGLLQE